MRSNDYLPPLDILGKISCYIIVLTHLFHIMRSSLDQFDYQGQNRRRLSNPALLIGISNYLELFFTLFYSYTFKRLTFFAKHR